MAILKSTNINDTGYLALPVGTTAQRIGTAAGTLVYFTSVGTTSWTVPANVDTVEVLAVGGGGGEGGVGVSEIGGESRGGGDFASERAERASVVGEERLVGVQTIERALG